MISELRDLTIDVGFGRVAHITVEDKHIVMIKFQKGIAPISIANSPDLLINALSQFKKQNENFKPTCLLYQGPDFVVYYFERIL